MACVRTSGLEGAGELGTRQIAVEIMPNQCPAKDFCLILHPWYNDMWTAAECPLTIHLNCTQFDSAIRLTSPIPEQAGGGRSGINLLG